MELSNSLGNINTVASIAFALKDVDPANVVFLQYPSATGMSGTQSGVLPITSAANTLFSAIKADRPVELTGSTGIGSKLNPNATPSPSASRDPSASRRRAPRDASGSPSASAATRGREGQPAGVGQRPDGSSGDLLEGPARLVRPGPPSVKPPARPRIRTDERVVPHAQRRHRRPPRSAASLERRPRPHCGIWPPFSPSRW